MKKNILSKTLIWDISLLLVAMVWGGGFVITKNALDAITPLYFLSFRFMIAGLIMFILFFKRIVKASLTDIKNGCIVGVFLALGFITQTFGAALTTPAKSSFITGINVVLVPFVLMSITRKLPGRKSIITAFAAFAGMAFLSLNETLVLGLGDLLTLLCALFYACHIVSIGHFANKSDTYVLASVQIIFTGVCCSILALFFETAPTAINTGLWSGILYSALLSTLAAFLIQNLAQKNTPSTHAAIILCLESVFGALASVIFWHETMTTKMLLGCILIFTAIFANEVDIMALMKSRKKLT